MLNPKVLLIGAIFLFFPSKLIGQKLVDTHANVSTKTLYRNMITLSKKGVMVGQQDALYSGVGWKGKSDKSDIKDLIGKHPIVVGWDFGLIETGSKVNYDKIAFDSIVVFSKRVHDYGGINTFSWHSNNPLDITESVKSTKIKSTVKQILSDTIAQKYFDASLDSVAKFITKLTTPNGDAIPILFRPFHENNGNWFWWGNLSCTPEEFKSLWKYTVHYLRDKKEIHNLIYVYSTDKFTSEQQYLNRYPGDEFVDILGFDSYDNDKQHSDTTDFFKEKMTIMVGTLKKISKTKLKPYALTETGYMLMPKKNWWTKTLSPILLNSGISYILLWVNAGATGFWGTYPGQLSSLDFKEFSKNKSFLFQSSTIKKALQQK